jgi:hypothetical protein
MAEILKVGAALLLVGLLSGCRVGLDVALDVEADGGGRLSVALTADPQAQERAAAAGADPLASLAAVGRELEGWTVADRTGEDGTREVELSVEADDAEALSAQAAQLAAALDAPEGRILEPLRVAVTADRVRVEGGAALQPAEGVAELGLTPEQAVALLESRDALDYTVTVTLPAEVLSSTAPVVEDATLVWPVAPGERVEIAAEGVRPRFPWPPVLAAGAVVALAAVLVAVSRGRGRRPGRAP